MYIEKGEPQGHDMKPAIEQLMDGSHDEDDEENPAYGQVNAESEETL